jgi:hypothetical protein
MLKKQHLVVDGPPPKCCFSSTMRKQTTPMTARIDWRGMMQPMLAVLAVLWLAGCADMAPRYSADSYQAPETAAPMSPWNAPVKPAPEVKSRRAAEERPGLATGFGESVRSEWQRQSFVRAAASPAGTGVVYYNDREGFKAMAGYASSADALKKAAGNRIEWGIRSGVRYLPAYETSSWRHEHGGRRFVVGSEGSDYSIVVKNLCKSRLELVLSVDGLDVIDGKAAAYAKRGYVIAPGETLEIKGWRTSPDRVARFRFSTVAGSYANLRHGDHRNVGVIGLAVFDEKGVDPWKWMPDEVSGRFAASPFENRNR